jgi:hypothetical protein
VRETFGMDDFAAHLMAETTAALKFDQIAQCDRPRFSR